MWHPPGGPGAGAEQCRSGCARVGRRACAGHVRTDGNGTSGCRGRGVRAPYRDPTPRFSRSARRTPGSIRIMVKALIAVGCDMQCMQCR